jgi:Ca2+-transporting ATPase
LLFHSKSLDAIKTELGADFLEGLTNDEASHRTTQYGENKLDEKKKKTMLQRFAEQFRDVMIIILIFAAVISFVVACVEGNPREFFEPVLILLIVVLNAVMGVLQESRAEKALDALKNMSAPHARVIREGKEAIIDASLLVPGDIILLEAGDFIPADARIIDSSSLKCEESALTGESLPVEKNPESDVSDDAPLGDRINMVYSGCSVTYGTAKAVVVSIGMHTEMGKIANMLSSESETDTPLQNKLAQLGKYLGIVALAACAVIFLVGVFNKIAVLEIFMTSVSLAVSAIPEGLPAIVTIVLSIGVQRMVKRRALIRRLPAVETLGSASVICSDKTGTLTQNRMTVVKVWSDRDDEPMSVAKGVKGNSLELLKIATLCCNGSVSFIDNKEEHIGDPTETAIVKAAYDNGFNKDELLSNFPRLLELPFDSDRKLMSTVNRIGDKKFVIVKGAFDEISKRCIGGNIEKARVITEKLGGEALRVLAVAIRQIDEIPENPNSDTLENNLVLFGLIAMIDPPRPEARDAVAICKKAGIKPVMITGDHIITASAIARDLGILDDNGKSITGAELDAMSDEELDSCVEQISVYARVSPENKIRIVKAWQRKGQVVSMTGDGVNDAPALKAADIGCAMGITGTDVAKGAADMILTDDNFATIVDAVREGRGIYANIKKVVGFLLGTNIGEIILVFVAMLLWHETPLLSMQLLWINLVTDSLPAIALGMEDVESDIMTLKPKPKNESLFANGMGIRVVLQGAMFAGLSLIAFVFGKGSVNGDVVGGQTLAFFVLAVSQVIQAFNMRSTRSLFKIGVFGNKNLNKAVFISLALVALVLFTPVRVAFQMIILPWYCYLVGLLLALVPVAIMEGAKALGLIR